MGFSKSTTLAAVLLLLVLAGLVASAGCGKPASATEPAAACTQWAIKIEDIKASPDPEGGEYFLVPSGWEPINAGIVGTIMRKCVKP